MRGLNTVQLDIKDENGEVGFVPSAVPFANEVGAAKRYYRPRAVAKLARKRGVYLIGRIVCFEDPVLSAARPEIAIQRTDGSRWKNHAGLGWTNPYDKRVWRYLGDLGGRPRALGFDEIQFDYVRFPTDGDVEAVRYPSKTSTPMGWVIPEFVQYASKRLKQPGARVSADVFGLAATRDLGIGQMPRRISATSTRSTRWSTRRTTAPASTGWPTRTRRPARPSPPRCGLRARARGRGGRR